MRENKYLVVTFIVVILLTFATAVLMLVEIIHPGAVSGKSLKDLKNTQSINQVSESQESGELIKEDDSDTKEKADDNGKETESQLETEAQTETQTEATEIEEENLSSIDPIYVSKENQVSKVGNVVSVEVPPAVLLDPNPAADGQVTVCLDPGHGGRDVGCESSYNSNYEKNINLTIATEVKRLLEAEGIRVIMTRTDDTAFETRYGRVDYAYNNGADYLISIHVNSNTSSPNANGCMGIVTYNSYQAPGSLSPSVYQESMDLSTSILTELHSLGLGYSMEAKYENGILQRVCTDDKVYADGSLQDYYGIINRSMEYGIPATIIEHGYLSNQYDAVSFLTTQDQILSLAQADARGILSFLSSRAPR